MSPAKTISYIKSLIAWITASRCWQYLFIKNPTKTTMWVCLIIITYLHVDFEYWKDTTNVFRSDVKEYYAYLPALFIYQDLDFKWVNSTENLRDRVWYKIGPTGKPHVSYTMGMAIAALPFFLIGHLLALISGIEADGYTTPYAIAMLMGSVFYLGLGLFYLRKLLLKYFKPYIVAITMVAILFGTNLLYYTFIEALMSHIFSFSLIIVFIFLLENWLKKPGFRSSLILGLISALIILIRPPNVIILILYLLWNVGSIGDLKKRFILFYKSFPQTILLIVIALLIVVPQLIYWKAYGGSYFFNAYGDEAYFFFNDPEVSNVLFSYRKGWFVYTPLMLFAVFGIPFMFKRLRGKIIPVVVVLILTTYIISSWYMWFFGGSFGHRAFIDIYGIMAIPLAAIISWAFSGKFILKLISGLLIFAIIYLNIFQTNQIYHGAIHWAAMTKDAYWETFGKSYPTERFYKLLDEPDVEALDRKVRKAREN